MAESLDVQMNQLPTATDVAYIYAEASDGSQVKIARGDLLQFCKSYEYNTNLDSMIGRDARIVINQQYGTKNPTAAKSPMPDEWAVVEVIYFPVGELTMQTATSWFNPKVRKIRNHENGAWDNWMDI